MKKHHIYSVLLIGSMGFACSPAEDTAIESQAVERTESYDPSLPEVQHCLPQADGQHFVVSYRHSDGSPCMPRGTVGCDSAIYACKQPIPFPIEYIRPNDPDADTDCAGAYLRRRAIVIAGAGAEIRYNAFTCSAGSVSLIPRATLLVFSGGGGTGFRDGYGMDGSGSYGVIGRDTEGENDYRSLERLGARVVAVKWAPGVFVAAWDLGWMTRVSGHPSTLKLQAKRPATVIGYVGRTLVATGTEYGVAGTSGGSLQTASMLWHDVGVPVDYAGFHAGGGITPSLPHQCGAAGTVVRIHKDTGAVCLLGDNCGPGFDDPELPLSVKLVIDYVHNANDCAMKQLSEDGLLLRSSFLSTSWEGNAPAACDYLVNSDDETVPPDSDLALSAVWGAGIMRIALFRRAGIRGGWANGSGFHGQVMQSGHESFALFKAGVRAGLGI